jgi:hypothetical protein
MFVYAVSQSPAPDINPEMGMSMLRIGADESISNLGLLVIPSSSSYTPFLFRRFRI